MADDNIITLKQERARLVTEMRAIHEKAEGENRSKTAEERAEFDRLDAAQTEVSHRVNDAEKTRALDGVKDEFAKRIDPGTLGLGADERSAADEQRKQVEGFAKYLRSGVMPDGGSVGENGGLLARTYGDPRNEMRTDFAKGTTTLGGFTVPQSFSDMLFSVKIQQGAVRRTKVHTYETGDGRDMPVPVRTALLAAGWLTEGTAPTATADTFAQVTLKALAGGALAKISLPLIQDSAFDLSAEIAKVLGTQIGRLQNLAYVFGTGTTQPLGMSLVNDIAATVGGVSVGECETAAAAGPTADEVFTWVYTLAPQYRQNAEMMLHDSAFRVISQLKSTTGDYLWRPSLRDGEPDKLLNIPVFNDPDLQATGTDEHVVGIVADFDNFYAIRDVKEVEIIRMNERYADALQVGFLGYQRTDGHIIDAAAGVQLACGAA